MSRSGGGGRRRCTWAWGCTHHERCNGSGYRHRLHGYQIREAARLVAAMGWAARRTPLYDNTACVRALTWRLALDGRPCSYVTRDDRPLFPQGS